MGQLVSAPDPKASLDEQLQWLGSQTLAFADERSETRFEARELADEIALAVNLTSFEPRECHQAFVHRASYLLAGDMVISAAAYVPLVASTSDYSESTLEIPYFSSTRFRIDGQDWYNHAGLQALYLPGQSYAVETGHFNGLLFNLNPERLAEAIRTVSLSTVSLELAKHWVRRPVPIDLRDRRVRHLQRHLELALGALVEFNGHGLGNPLGAMALGVERLAYRCSAQMLLLAMGTVGRPPFGAETTSWA
jgi:hypothetical protein